MKENPYRYDFQLKNLIKGFQGKKENFDWAFAQLRDILGFKSL